MLPLAIRSMLPTMQGIARPRTSIRLLALSILTLSIGNCTMFDRSTGPVAISVIGVTEDLRKPGDNPLSPPAKLMLEATARGLVAFDATGEITPALAERWIVEDAGRSYIFRIRRAQWADGGRVTAQNVAALLKQRIAQNRKLDPAGDLTAVKDVLAMTGEVVEIRLRSARPSFLQLLAQPQMGLFRRRGGSGPFRAEWNGRGMLLTPIVTAIPDPDDGPAPPIPVAARRFVRAESGPMAIARFATGHAALVLGGRYQDLPILPAVGINQRQIRTDPVLGLFGIAIGAEEGLMADRSIREAISMAIDRAALSAQLKVDNWTTMIGIVPRQMDLTRQPVDPRWAGMSLPQRRDYARKVVASWRSVYGDPPSITIALPEGTGSRLLFIMLRADLRAIGLSLKMAEKGKRANMALIDEVAAYDSPFWYLSRISCPRGLSCDPMAMDALTKANAASDPAERQQALDEAERLALTHGGYVPLGLPIRWSLVAQRLTGFQTNGRARHPLNELVRDTTSQ